MEHRSATEELGAQLEALLGRTVALEPVGWPLRRHLVFRVGGANAFAKLFLTAAETKFAHACWAYEALDAVDISTPRLLAKGTLADGAPWLLASALPGNPASLMSPAPTQRTALLRDLGSFAAKLHSVDLGALDEERTLGAEQLERVASRYRRYNRSVLAIPCPEQALFREADLVMQQLEPTLLRSTGVPRVFVHGDFSLRNVLVTRADLAIVGLIDFENAHAGDAAEDLARIHMKDLAVSGDFTAFFAGYRMDRELDAGVESRMHYYFCGIVFEVAAWARERAPEYYGAAVRRLGVVLR